MDEAKRHEQGMKIRRLENREVISCGAMDLIFWPVSGMESDGYSASRVVGNTSYELGGESGFVHSLQYALAMRIIANSADKADFMSQIMSVQGEVERRSAQVLCFRENVPQYFAHTYNFHASCEATPS